MTFGLQPVLAILFVGWHVQPSNNLVQGDRESELSSIGDSLIYLILCAVGPQVRTVIHRPIGPDFAQWKTKTNSFLRLAGKGLREDSANTLRKYRSNHLSVL